MVSSLMSVAELRGLDDEERRGVVVEEEVLVGLVELLEVLGIGLERRRLPDRRGRLRSATEQHVGRRLQIDDEIGWRYVAGQQIVEPLVDEELVVVQVQIREDLVAVEEVVGDRELAEEVRLPQRRLLAMAIEQVKELRLKRGARTIGVEVGEKGIVASLRAPAWRRAACQGVRRAPSCPRRSVLQPRCSESARRHDDIIAS